MLGHQLDHLRAEPAFQDGHSLVAHARRLRRRSAGVRIGATPAATPGSTSGRRKSKSTLARRAIPGSSQNSCRSGLVDIRVDRSAAADIRWFIRATTCSRDQKRLSATVDCPDGSGDALTDVTYL